MANDKTEEATPKRKAEARKKGQVAKSADLTQWLGTLVGLYLLPAALTRLGEQMMASFQRLGDFSHDPNPNELPGVLAHSLLNGFTAIVPLVLAAMVTGVVATVGQTGLLLTGKPLKPDFKRMNPITGFKRLFSPRSLWEVAKQLLKLTIVLAVGWPRMRGMFDAMVGHGRLSLGNAMAVAIDSILGLARIVAWTVVILAVLDWRYQKFQMRRDLRMSKQDIRDEHRQAEGDQMVKGRIRAIQRSMARNRMLADVMHADVVVTNPTHIAVALHYDPDKGGAPRVTAVGAGAIAARIREKAKEHSVPMVEAKPLARALWRSCEVGDPIPVTLYEAVAKVLAFVRRLDRRMTSARPIDLPKASQVDARILEAVERKKKRKKR